MTNLTIKKQKTLPGEYSDVLTNFSELDDIIFKKYLERLEQFSVISNTQSLESAIDKTAINQIKKIVYDKEEDNLDKLTSVFSSMASHGSAVFVILDSDGHKTDVYLGTQSMSEGASYQAIETFERSLKASFPGIDTKKSFVEDIEKISEKILSEETQFVTSVSGVPSLKDSESESFIQGIDKIVEGMEGKEYLTLMLATPVSRFQLEQTESAYQELYSSLSFLESQQVTLSESQSDSVGKTIGKTLSTSLSNTQANTSSTSKGHTTGTNQSKTTSLGTAVTGTAAGVGLLVGGPVGAAIGGVAGGIVGSMLGSTTQGSSSSETTTETTGKTETTGTTNTKGSNESDSFTKTNQQGINRQYSLKNRRITTILELIDEQLTRIRDGKNHGMWNWGTYFISSQKSSTQIGADLLAGILSGESTGVERNAILNWSDLKSKPDFSAICKSLAHFTHPVFDTSSEYSFQQTTPTSLISTKELAVGMSLPQKSLPGIPVFDSVEFGRSVSTYRDAKNEDLRDIKIGSIIHLDSVSKDKNVSLDIDSLTAHLFVTGSTGSGKSNTIYSLLHSLWKKQNIPFLIIEPAKGEYKDAFGGYRGVNVFGTNVSLSPLLKLNPFSFPNGIHITEHIDRLIEILNAVWPMYAAMPAVLKAGIEKSYEKLGWNLISSHNQYGADIFPDFDDLLDVMPHIIENSAYSAEMKGNYIGALVTRIESLTNGYYRTIFRKEELANKDLFDKPCIVDLSRVGSSETKSLLMGIVFMKLQEYRMSESKGSNSKLKHITVLEEAHNLMRRTSSEQSGEGANLQGKAVEMIANAIAEMRTYGEGFIIADQAPGLLDQSVIRNTNTKMILRLPDWEDRELVGKSANLKEEQIEELARLRTGCAAIYQNEWQEAVLCQFELFDKALIKPFKYETSTVSDINDIVEPRIFYKTKLIELYLSTVNHDVLINNKKSSAWLDEALIYYPHIVTQLKKSGKFNKKYFLSLIQFSDVLDTITSIDLPKPWLKELINRIDEKIDTGALSREIKKLLVDHILDHLITLRPDQKEIWRVEKAGVSIKTEEFV